MFPYTLRPFSMAFTFIFFYFAEEEFLAAIHLIERALESHRLGTRSTEAGREESKLRAERTRSCNEVGENKRKWILAGGERGVSGEGSVDGRLDNTCDLLRGSKPSARQEE